MGRRYFIFAVLCLVVNHVHSQDDDDDTEPPPQPGTSDPPDFLPSLGLPVCADVMLIIDVSESISPANRRKVVAAAKSVYEQLNVQNLIGNPSVRVGAITFRKSVTHHFYLSDYNTKAAFAAAIEGINTTASGPRRTHTHKAFDEVMQNYFIQKNGDREGFANVILYFGDAKTYTSNRFPKVQKFLSELHARTGEEKIQVELILVPSEFDRTPDALLDTEKEIIPSEPIDANTFYLTDEQMIAKLVTHLTMEFNCRLSDQNSNICADIVMGFDVSCSVVLKHRELSVQVATDVAQELSEHDGIDYYTFTFDDDVYNEFTMSGEHDRNAIQDNFSSINLTERRCRTRTQVALQRCIDILHANVTGFDRDDNEYPDTCVLYYDGVAYPQRLREKTIDAAKELRKLGIHVIVVKLWNNYLKFDPGEEFKAIPTGDLDCIPGKDQGFLTEKSEEEVVATLLMQLQQFQCGQSLKV